MQPQREQLRIYFRRRQIVDETGNVVIQCNSDGSAEYVPGTVDPTWVEMTEFVDGLDKVSLDWDNVNSGSSGETTETNKGGSNYDKGISLSLTLNNTAFEFVRDWLDISPCSTLNAVEVMITDFLCKKNYRTFEIKADNLTYSPFGAPCEYEVKLREADPVWHCIHKTFIWDNWQEWFIDGSVKNHPCFLTGIESRPRLLSSVRMGISIFAHTIPIVSAIFNENLNYARRINNVDNFVDAPLIRDFISNVTDKCGLSVDTIFHDPASPYYNLCLYFPLSGQMHQSDESPITSPALWFHFENRWNITLAELLDKLKPVFNAEWYVTPNNQLVFKPKAEFLNTTPILDFTLDINERLWDKYSLRYTFNGNKKPAYGRYSYTIDASDLASQELQPLYNDIIDYDGPKNNLMLEGNISKNFEFASTGAIRDGRSKRDYLIQTVSDGETVAYALVIILSIVVLSLTLGVITAPAAGFLAAFIGDWVTGAVLTPGIAGLANDLRDEFNNDAYTGAVRLTSEQTATPRLLLWDGTSFNRAKMTQVAAAAIVPNTFYNPTSEIYMSRNKFMYGPGGIFNYEMYFDGFFTDNLFDRFHDEIDNPMKSLIHNQTFELTAFLCCEMLDLLGVWEGDFAKIGYFIKLEERETMDIIGRIEHFTVNYDDATINIKGQAFRITNGSA
jgi:hypothetical protein